MPKGDEHFAEHLLRRTIKPPPILYKYTTLDTARIVLSTGKIRFQSPLQYNDPLDSQWDPHWPIRTPEARAHERIILEQAMRDPQKWPPDADPRFKQAMDRVRSQIMNLSDAERENAIAEFVKDAEKSEVPEPLKRRILDIRRRMRVLCLSETDRSVLMWSHYASQHKGVVLGFDATAMENMPKRPLEPVKYCDALPRLIDSDAWAKSMVFGLPPPRLEGEEREWALTKHADWHYEREWRFVWIAPPGTLGDHEDFPFPRNALVEVIAGCRTDPARSTELLALALAIQPQVKHFRMSIHPSRFDLVKSSVE